MQKIQDIKNELKKAPKKWLVTGAAGFIGSHLVETLLSWRQDVVALDNFTTGHQRNIEMLCQNVGEEAATKLTFIEGDISDKDTCFEACKDRDYVLHQAALGSVPRSVANPEASHQANVDGFISMLVAAKEAKVKSFVYASSSSVYGDHPELPKVEAQTGKVLSPYAATKAANELYAQAFSAVYEMKIIGLRYFNVFGPRQDPAGAYAAVIPKWIARLLKGEEIEIYGDGETSRDFCYVDNAVQANILAAVADNAEAFNQAYNIAVGNRTSLNELYELLKERVEKLSNISAPKEPAYKDFRPGDVRHSLASIEKAETLLGYSPTHNIASGLDETVQWFVENSRRNISG